MIPFPLLDWRSLEPYRVLVIPLLVNIFPNKLALNVPKNIPRNPPFCSLTSFRIVSQTPFNNKPESSRDLTIFLMSSFHHLILLVLLFQSLRFLFIPTSATDAAAINPNGIKTLLANILITFFINGNPVFCNGPRSLPRNPPYCIILDN